jgi:hypothetical protein
MSTKEVKGKNLSGEEMIYTFVLIDALNGLKIFHEYVPTLVHMLPDGIDLKKLEKGVDLKLGMDIKEIVDTIVDVLPFGKLEELVGIMLAGGSVTTGNKKMEMGEDGFGEYAQGDPIAVYTALLYAFKANYPKYLDPLF